MVFNFNNYIKPGDPVDYVPSVYVLRQAVLRASVIPDESVLKVCSDLSRGLPVSDGELQTLYEFSKKHIHRFKASYDAFKGEYEKNYPHITEVVE